MRTALLFRSFFVVVVFFVFWFFFGFFSYLSAFLLIVTGSLILRVFFCHFKACPVGPEPNLLEPDVVDSHRVYLDHPILSCADVEAIKGCGLSWCKVGLVLCVN